MKNFITAGTKAAKELISHKLKDNLENVINTISPSDSKFNSINEQYRIIFSLLRGGYVKGNEKMHEASVDQAGRANINLKTFLKDINPKEFNFLLDHSINREVLKTEVQEMTKYVNKKSAEAIEKRQEKKYKKKPKFNSPLYPADVKEKIENKAKKNPQLTIGDMLGTIYRSAGYDIVPMPIQEFAQKYTKETTEIPMKEANSLLTSVAEQVQKVDKKLKYMLEDFNKGVDERAHGAVMLMPKQSKQIVLVHFQEQAKEIGKNLYKTGSLSNKEPTSPVYNKKSNPKSLNI